VSAPKEANVALQREVLEDLVSFAESPVAKKLFREAKSLGAICFYLRTQGRHRGYVEKQGWPS